MSLELKQHINRLFIAITATHLWWYFYEIICDICDNLEGLKKQDIVSTHFIFNCTKSVSITERYA